MLFSTKQSLKYNTNLLIYFSASRQGYKYGIIAEMVLECFNIPVKFFMNNEFLPALALRLNQPMNEKADEGETGHFKG